MVRGKKKGGEFREWHSHIHTTKGKTDSRWGATIWNPRSSAQCHVMTSGGRDGRWEGRLKSEGICVYIWLIQDVAWHKLTQCCRAIIFRLKIERNEGKSVPLTVTGILESWKVLCLQFGLLPPGSAHQATFSS